MIQNDTKKTSKNINLFECKLCDFKCSKRGDFNRHVLRPKHIKNIKMIQKDTEKHQKNIACINEYICGCGNIYKHHSGLWRHKKECSITENEIVKTDSLLDKELIIKLINQNSELLEVVKNGTNNNTTINSHNKTFNLQVFLNETCKDAMNIMDFVDSIKLQLSDFERVGEVGFVNGISDIIIKNLKQLDITERPIHCTDKKREIMYVKDENKWEKEDDTNRKVRRAIKYIANKNINLMDAYKALYPDCQKSHSIYSDSYNKFVIEALGGSGNEDCDNEDKIISRLSKVVTIEK